MPVPTLVRQHLKVDETNHPDLPGLPLDGACMGAKHHSPRPLLLTEVDLPDGSHALLCGTCAGNLSTLLFMMRTYSGTLPWPVRREFGNKIRALAGC